MSFLLFDLSRETNKNNQSDNNEKEGGSTSSKHLNM